MKKLNKLAALLLCLMLAFSTIGCGAPTDETPSTAETTTAAETPDANDPWASAEYTEDQEFGEGETTVAVKVIVNEHEVTFTLHTDETILGAALLAHNLIAGEESEFGLYVKTVNGILADYDADQSYWAFTKGGEYMNAGVDSAEIADGEQYELVYTK